VGAFIKPEPPNPALQLTCTGKLMRTAKPCISRNVGYAGSLVLLRNSFGFARTQSEIALSVQLLVCFGRRRGGNDSHVLPPN